MKVNFMFLVFVFALFFSISSFALIDGNIMVSGELISFNDKILKIKQNKKIITFPREATNEKLIVGHTYSIPLKKDFSKKIKVISEKK